MHGTALHGLPVRASRRYDTSRAIVHPRGPLLQKRTNTTPMANQRNIEDYWCDAESPKVQLWFRNEESWSPEDERWTTRPDVTFVREFLAPRFSGRRVLDLGAGSGRFVHLWRAAEVELVSADWSPPLLKMLEERSRAHGARSEALDITKGPLAEEFDLVFATMFLIHLHPSKIRAAIRNIDRMASRHLCFTTWSEPGCYDDEGTEKLQSFSHDYPTLFAEVGWKPILNVGVAYGEKSLEEKNRLWYLEKG